MQKGNAYSAKKQFRNKAWTSILTTSAAGKSMTGAASSGEHRMTAIPASALSSSAPSITVRDAVYDLMRRFGMTSVFANPGSTELPMFRGFPSDFRYVLGLQEAV